MGWVEVKKYCLLDTHVLHWMQAEPGKLSVRARQALELASGVMTLSISAITLYELAQMFERGKIERQGTIEESVRMLTEGVLVHPITHAISAAAVEFPNGFPGDPGDRLIAATAMVENITLITADARIRCSGVVTTIW